MTELHPITIVTGKQFEQTVSASVENDGLNPHQMLDLFKTVFLGLGYSYEQWEKAITSELENL